MRAMVEHYLYDLEYNPLHDVAHMLNEEVERGGHSRESQVIGRFDQNTCNSIFALAHGQLNAWSLALALSAIPKWAIPMTSLSLYRRFPWYLRKWP